MSRRITLLVFLAAAFRGWAQEAFVALSDSALINFQQSKWYLDLSLGNNAAVFQQVNDRLNVLEGDSVYRIRHVNVFGGASPEGSEKINMFLSEKRAKAIFDGFQKFSKLDDSEMSFFYLGRDWKGVLRETLLDSNIPNREETISLLEEIAGEKEATGKEPANSLERLKSLKGGKPYRYLLANIFPKVRALKIVIDYSRQLAPEIKKKREEAAKYHLPIPQSISNIAEICDATKPSIDGIKLYAPWGDGWTTAVTDPVAEKPFYMDLRTNMLYDAMLLPNFGAQFYLGKRFSVGGNWMYGWWKKDRIHYYWRAYGGELNGRYWFGKKAKAKPLTGFHIGAYAQFYIYDFETGGKGEMGGLPGKSLWKDGVMSAGFEFGFTCPIKKRLNLDFSIGAGYTHGKYHKYVPVGDLYVWQGSYIRNYFGPTKLEVALVWLIGRSNTNKRQTSNVGTRYIASPASTQRKEVPNE